MNNKNDIKKWWSANPQTYGKKHGTTVFSGEEKDTTTSTEFGTKEFFENVDKHFYAWNKPLHLNKVYFSKIFPYDKFKNKKVLEIGCGMGTMISNWARHGATVTGVDLNPVSIEQTKKRFELYNLKGTFFEDDANNLSFNDNEFDFVYSWGVLHHSPDIKKSINEMFRVLKPGGPFGLMVYNRNSILYKYSIQYLEGFLHLENRFNDELSLASRYTDGRLMEGNPYTWPLTKKEIKNYISPYATNLSIKLLGTELDFYFKLLIPGFGIFIPKFIKKCWARRFGWSIWASGTTK